MFENTNRGTHYSKSLLGVQSLVLMLCKQFSSKQEAHFGFFLLVINSASQNLRLTIILNSSVTVGVSLTNTYTNDLNNMYVSIVDNRKIEKTQDKSFVMVSLFFCIHTHPNTDLL